MVSLNSADTYSYMAWAKLKLVVYFLKVKKSRRIVPFLDMQLVDGA